MPAYATYRTFTDSEEADALRQVLAHHGIPYRIDRAKPAVDLSFDPDHAHERILVFLPLERFADADRAQEAAAPDASNSDLEHHYLQDFSNEELLEILYKSHEWHPGDVMIARKLLETRGVKEDPAMIADKRLEEIIAIREPVAGPPNLIAAGFLLALLGGILGIVLGWSFVTLKERDPNGEEFYKYDGLTRSLGIWMIVSGLSSLLLLVLAFCAD